MNIDVRLKASLTAAGNVVCDLECDGQSAQVVFTGTEVLLAVPEPRETP